MTRLYQACHQGGSKLCSKYETHRIIERHKEEGRKREREEERGKVRKSEKE